LTNGEQYRTRIPSQRQHSIHGRLTNGERYNLLLYLSK
jgi:hypothetical protein